MTFEEFKKTLKKNKKAILTTGGIILLGTAGTIIGIRVKNAKPKMPMNDICRQSEDLPLMDLSDLCAENTEHWIEENGLDKYIINGICLEDMGELGKRLAKSMEVNNATTSLVVETIEVV